MSWTATKIYFQNSDAYKKAYQGSELLWEKQTPVTGSVIYYTSDNGSVVTPNAVSWGANIVSNTYSGGQGTITFDGIITAIPMSAFSSLYHLKTITIPNTVTSIGKTAFRNVYYLESINLTNAITSIGDEAFENCNLSSITIPASVTSIGVNPFGSSNIRNITVDSSNTVYDSRNNCNAIIKTADNTLVSGCTNTVIPDDVTTIGKYAFYGNNMSNSSITVPASVTTINDYGFYSLIFIESFIFESSTPATIGNGVFNGTDDCPIFVPMGKLDIYKSAWSTYASRIFEYQPNDEIWYTNENNESVSLGNNFTFYNSDSNPLSYNTYFDSSTQRWIIKLSGDLYRILGDFMSFNWGGPYASQLYFPESLRYLDNVVCGADANISYFGGRSPLVSSDNLLLFSDEDHTKVVASVHNGTDIETITIPEGVISLGAYSCGYNNTTTAYNLPSTISELGGQAFEACGAIETINCYATSAPSTNPYTFYAANQNGTLHTPVGYSYMIDNLPNGWTTIDDLTIE